MRRWLKISLVVLPLACLVAVTAELKKKSVPVEVIPLDEASKNKALAANIVSRLGKQRDVHTKAHGCIDGARVKVLKEIPESLRLGIFKNSEKEYDAIIRLSNGSGDPGVKDSSGGGQGYALKILFSTPEEQALANNISIEKWFENKKYYLTQDILGINRVSEFFVENVDDYFALFAAQGAIAAKTKEMKEQGKSEAEIGEMAKATMDKMFIHPSAEVNRERQAIVLGKLRQIRTKDPLVETYHSMVPSRLGNKLIKYAHRPCKDVDPDAVAIPEGIKADDPNLNREMAKHHLKSGATCYKVSVVVHDEDKFPPLESPASPWPVTMNDYVDVLEVNIPQKMEGKELMDEELCETISFTPWHSLAEHMPVGAVQRTRLEVYAAVANQRNINAGRKEVPKN